jgi:hypothetical protein
MHPGNPVQWRVVRAEHGALPETCDHPWLRRRRGHSPNARLALLERTISNISQRIKYCRPLVRGARTVTGHDKIADTVDLAPDAPRLMLSIVHLPRVR